jgi:TfoX/Sxy family transcriptional regulator of competence genes
MLLSLSNSIFMAHDEKLAERVRQALYNHLLVEEKKMMGGLTFMVNRKMCVGIVNDELMYRINPDIYGEALKRKDVVRWIYWPADERLRVCK